MIFPATYDITVLQDATWRGVFRATENRKTITSVDVDAGAATFNLSCHGLSADDKVVFTGDGGLPCGLNFNTVYYVISANLTTDSFEVSATIGGASVTVSGSASGDIYVANPINITSYTVDADIAISETFTIATSFVPTLTDPVNGEFSLELGTATTISLDPGRNNYVWDLSLTSPGGDRYYWLTGAVTVQRTYSRV